MKDKGRAFTENLPGLASPWSRAANLRLLAGRVHHAVAKFGLLPFPGNEVRGTSPPNLFPLDLEQQCHGFRPVVVAALGGHHHLPIEAELDYDPEPGQLVIA